MFVSLTNLGMQINLIRHEPLTLSSMRILNSFSNSFTAMKVFHQVTSERMKLCIKNGGWHETMNLLHVSRCKMLYFVTSYMKQNKSRKQTLEIAQNGLEIIFKEHSVSILLSFYKFKKTVLATLANVFLHASFMPGIIAVFII